MPLRHLVFIEILNDPDAICLIREQLYNLSRKIAGCFRFDFGRCSNDSNYHYFLMDFESTENRDSYLENSEHKKNAQEIIIPRLKNGIKSVIVFDYIKNKKNVIKKKYSEEYGYVLIKEEKNEILKEIEKNAEKINSFKILKNCSTEEFGKEYVDAIKIKFAKGSDSLRIKSGRFFDIKLHTAPLPLQSPNGSHNQLPSL